jgi:hypothetical protein
LKHLFGVASGAALSLIFGCVSKWTHQMTTKTSSAKRSWPRVAILVFIVVTILTGLVLGFGEIFSENNDAIFRGKPESEWIKELKYSDSQQANEWRAYGDEGVQVLIRGLERARRNGRAYRRFNERLPAFLRQFLPTPKPDSTASIRMCIASLLLSLGNDAKSAAPIMIWTANNDEAVSVRQLAIGYFNYNGADNCPLNQLPAPQKEKLAPAYLRAIQDAANAGLRHNASIGIKYFPDQRDAVAPVLVKALQDSDPYVRVYAAEGLNRLAPDVAKDAGAMSLLIACVKNPKDPVAPKAVAALAHAGSQPAEAVPALIECLQGTNTLIACEAVWALEWAPKEFDAYANVIIPALAAAAERKNNASGYAKVALGRWQAKPAR